MATRIVLLRSPPWRTTCPHLTYQEVFQHLVSTGKARHIQGEMSTTRAPDGYLPHSWNVLTELDVLPPPVAKEATFLNEAIAAIEAKAKATELSGVRQEEAQAAGASVDKGDNTHVDGTSNGGNTTTVVSGQKGYGNHSAAVTAAAMQHVWNAPGELHLEGATLLGRRGQKGSSGLRERSERDATHVDGIRAADQIVNKGTETGGTDLVANGGDSTSTAEASTTAVGSPQATYPSINTTSNPQVLHPTLSNLDVPLPPVPAENYLFNYTTLSHSLKYLRLSEQGFTSPWTLSPLGTSCFLTIEGTTPTPSSTPNITSDSLATTVLCSYISIPSLPNTTLSLPLLSDFLLPARNRRRDKGAGAGWTPDSKHVTRIELVRGDTLILPPCTLYQLHYTHDTLTSNGIFMLRANLRLSLQTWKWDSLGKSKRAFTEAKALLEVFKSEVRRDPEGCGVAGESGLVQVERDCAVIEGELEREGEGSEEVLRGLQMGVAREWEEFRRREAGT
ncbi:uncharacterized protein K444DRAFT_632405 [Hyaloscypha bicolor E]|uniref:Uncharacterized protein n=1 Tax=Hyaloscypha bicolor E TaxID=1095630 RepID=A0A2J6T2N8_9HELO|nr:uncharacterized protein K444DRAFT_632405 [Hyaloscypha bicolor E]PMD57288.1 hypothetical protein K444DRAFT_632405 [Hyaloscypha bicolor E]